MLNQDSSVSSAVSSALDD